MQGRSASYGDWHLARQRGCRGRNSRGSIYGGVQRYFGLDKASNQPVTIIEAQTANTSGTYVQQLGSLMVTISPQGAIDAGAKWRRVGTGTWQDSAVAEAGIPVGQYAVEFNDISVGQSLTISR